MAETSSISTETQGSEIKPKEGIASKSCFLLNCDHTCSLEPAKNLLKSIEEQVGFVISPIVQRYFDLRKMADICEVKVKVKVYYKISLYSTFFNLHCSQLAIASRGEQWLDIYTRKNK